MSKIRAFKLADIANVKTGPGVAQSKAVQYVNIDADRGAWNGWEFAYDQFGLRLTPPWRGDSCLVPWANVKYVLEVPASTPAKVSK